MKNTVGTKAYLDSFEGLIPCVVTNITSEGVTVDFDEAAPALHWSGQTKNAWAGHKGWTFHASQVVPRSKMLDLSKAHCPAKTFDAEPLRWQAHEHGWIVWVQPEATPPAWLTPAHDQAIAKDCLLIQFDADAEVDASLPTFTNEGEGLPVLSVDDLVTTLNPNGGEDDEGNDRIKPGATGQVLSVFWGPNGWYYAAGFGKLCLFFNESEFGVRVQPKKPRYPSWGEE